MQARPATANPADSSGALPETPLRGGFGALRGWAGCLKFCGISGRQPERECIFLHECRHSFPKNAGSDVHAVTSDFTGCPAILCHRSDAPPFPKKGRHRYDFNFTFRQMNQISSAYSRIVRSEENLPAPAMLCRHFLAKAISSSVARMASRRARW